MKSQLLFLPLLAAMTLSGPALSQDDPEVEACRSTGLIALKERSPSVKDVVLDKDSLSISKADTKIEDIRVRTIIMGDAYLERTKSEKPHQFVCIIGEKGKVLLTFFTQK